MLWSFKSSVLELQISKRTQRIGIYPTLELDFPTQKGAKFHVLGEGCESWTEGKECKDSADL